ncbi:MAG: substrate-binding domain-containing protein [Planctomycetota bacterium]
MPSTNGRLSQSLLCVTVLLLAALLVSCDGKRPVIRLATTTSMHNSGLLDVLVPAFTAQSQYDVQVFAVGSGQALELARRADVDMVLVHAREREDRFIEDGYGVDRRDIMWNEFVIVGPPNDPAGIRGMPTAVAAFRQIAAARATFVSRGDDSGTHIRERQVWATAAVDPDWEQYLSAGQAMGACLMMADEKRAYVLSDRGTWLAFSDRIDSEVLVSGDAQLRNPYGAILVNPDKHPAGGVEATGARVFLEFLTSASAQRLINEFRKNGEPLFHAASGSD